MYAPCVVTGTRPGSGLVALCAVPGVDCSRRIALYGASWGGALALAAPWFDMAGHTVSFVGTHAHAIGGHDLQRVQAYLPQTKYRLAVGEEDERFGFVVGGEGDPTPTATHDNMVHCHRARCCWLRADPVHHVRHRCLLGAGRGQVRDGLRLRPE